MSFEQWVALGSALLSFVGLLLVFIQLRANTRIHLCDINRELITLGFTHPELFKVLSDAQDVDPAVERHYLQIWLNQLAIIHSHIRQGFFVGDLRGKLKEEIAEFMLMDNMQRHWKQFGKHYPASFQNFVKKAVTKAGRKKPD